MAGGKEGRGGGHGGGKVGEGGMAGGKEGRGGEGGMEEVREGRGAWQEVRRGGEGGERRRGGLTLRSFFNLLDVLDETGVQNFTSLPRKKWAEIRQHMMKSPVNRRSLHLIGSGMSLLVLETEAPDMEVGVVGRCG